MKHIYFTLHLTIYTLILGENTNPNLFENFLLKVGERNQAKEEDLDIVGGRQPLLTV